MNNLMNQNGDNVVALSYIFNLENLNQNVCHPAYFSSGPLQKDKILSQIPYVVMYFITLVILSKKHAMSHYIWAQKQNRQIVLEDDVSEAWKSLIKKLFDTNKNGLLKTLLFDYFKMYYNYTTHDEFFEIME